MKQVIKGFVGSFISLLITFLVILVVFYLYKITAISIFGIWGIALTPNQSTAVAFLTYIVLEALKGRGGNNG